MANVTATDVRYAGGWTVIQQPDAKIHSTVFIKAGDGWVGKILSQSSNGTTFAALTGNQLALVKAAECYYVASLLAGGPGKEDFEVGPIKSKSVKPSDNMASADYFFRKALEMLDKAGIVYTQMYASSSGEDDYYPTGSDDTQVDFGLAYSDPDEPFNELGVDS